jgi:putative DNA methylase
LGLFRFWAAGSFAGMSIDGPREGWYSRGYLPHCDEAGLVQAITFRLADSLPATVLQRWEWELAALSEADRKTERHRRIEDWLDAGHGACWLRDSRIARLVEDVLLCFDGERYRLLAWVVMPNHVHLLVETVEGWPLEKLMFSWKNWTAKEANKRLHRRGAFWQREFHDRYIRDGRHFAAAMQYLEQNPVKAGLCGTVEEWQWGSARRRREIPGSVLEKLL